MKTSLKSTLVMASAALVLTTGCVSSKKYHKSEADLAKVRADSTQQAQQIATLNGNVNDMQGKNQALQQSLDQSKNSYAVQQKQLDTYQGYFKQQQTAMTQVSDDVKNALTQAGIANGDVQQVNNVVYVRLDETELFRKNSAEVSTNGKKALDGLAQVLASKSNVHIFVGGGDSTSGNTMAMDNSNSNASDMTPVHHTAHHRVHHMTAAAGTSGTGAATAQTGTAAASTTQNTGTPVHHKVHHHYSGEGSMAFHNEPGMHNRAWAQKQARMVSVAHHFLKNGVNKVNVSIKQSDLNGTQDKTIKVIIMPKMEDFNPQSNSSASLQ